MKPVYSIFFHNYYGDHHRWLDFFAENIRLPAYLYYNRAESIYNETQAETGFQLPVISNKHLLNTISRQSPNKGKDIGGKMVLLDSYHRLGAAADYGLFLHDKKSLQKANNETWAGNLQKIATASFSEKAISIFEQEPGVGIVSAEGNLADEFNHQAGQFSSTNKTLLPGLQERFSVYPAAHHYVTGTMFWFRMKPLMDFFAIHPPLTIRQTLEPGNITDELQGSYTHCWERLLCWIITAGNYTIKMI